jgi:hypothetical protein
LKEDSHCILALVVLLIVYTSTIVGGATSAGLSQGQSKMRRALIAALLAAVWSGAAWADGLTELVPDNPPASAAGKPAEAVADNPPVLDVDGYCRSWAQKDWRHGSDYVKIEEKACIEDAQKHYDYIKVVWPHISVNARQRMLREAMGLFRNDPPAFYTALAVSVRIWVQDQQAARPAQPFKP